MAVACAVLGLLALAIAMGDDANKPQSENHLIPEEGIFYNPDMASQTMTGIDYRGSGNAQMETRHLIMDEISSNLNSIINANAYNSPYEIDFKKSIEFEDLVGSLEIQFIQEGLSVDYTGSGEVSNILDQGKDVNNLFDQILNPETEAPTGEIVEDAVVTEIPADESIQTSDN